MKIERDSYSKGARSQAVAGDVLPTETEMRKLLQQAEFTGIKIVDKQGSYLCTSTKP